MVIVEVRSLLTGVASFEEDNRYGILMIVDGFDVTVLADRFVSVYIEAVPRNGDKRVQEI